MPAVVAPTDVGLIAEPLAFAKGKPPAVEPSCTTTVSLSVSTVTSASSPVNALCWAVVPRRNLSAVAIMQFSLGQE